MEDLAALVDKSLLRCLPGGRYELLEVIREFAAEKLALDAEEEGDALVRHALHYAGLLERLRPRLAGGEKDDALARAASDMDNIRSAWRTATCRGLHDALLSAAGPLFTVLDCRGWHREAEEAFREAVEALPSTSAPGNGEDGCAPFVGRLLGRQGAAALRLGRIEHGEILLRRALELATRIGDKREAAFSLDRLSLAAYQRDAFEEARDLQREALRLRRELEDPREVGTSLNNLGSLHYAMGQPAEARALCEECLALQRRLGDRTGEVISLQNLGHISLALGDPDGAERHLQASLTAARRLRHGVLTARSLLGLGMVANSRGRSGEARHYLQPALARAMQIGAESLAVEAILGTASALAHEGNATGTLELVAVVLGHPDLEPEPRAAAERLLRWVEGSLPAETVEDALHPENALTLREAALRLAKPLPVE